MRDVPRIEPSSYLHAQRALRFLARDPKTSGAALVYWLGVVEPSREPSFFDAMQKFSPLTAGSARRTPGGLREAQRCPRCPGLRRCETTCLQAPVVARCPIRWAVQRPLRQMNAVVMRATCSPVAFVH